MSEDVTAQIVALALAVAILTPLGIYYARQERKGHRLRSE